MLTLGSGVVINEVGPGTEGWTTMGRGINGTTAPRSVLEAVHQASVFLLLLVVAVVEQAASFVRCGDSCMLDAVASLWPSRLACETEADSDNELLALDTTLGESEGDLCSLCSCSPSG